MPHMFVTDVLCKHSMDLCVSCRNDFSSIIVTSYNTKSLLVIGCALLEVNPITYLWISTPSDRLLFNREPS